MLRVNVLATAIVFLLLMPTVRIYASWFPDKKESLWLLPAGVTLISCLLWFLASLSLPLLIRWRVVADLRKDLRPPAPLAQKMIRTLSPILVSIFHTGMVIWFCAALIRFMQSNAFDKLFTHTP